MNKTNQTDQLAVLKLAVTARLLAHKADDAKREAAAAERVMEDNTDPAQGLRLACRAHELAGVARDVALEAEAAEKRTRIALEEGIGTARTVGEFQDKHRDEIARAQMSISDEALRREIDRFADKLPRSLCVLSSKEWDALESELKELLGRINKHFYFY